MPRQLPKRRYGRTCGSSVVPIRKSDGHLPIGVQIIGGFLEDRTTIKFAELIEREFGGFKPPNSA